MGAQPMVTSHVILDCGDVLMDFSGEKAAGRYAVGLSLRLPAQHCSGSAAF